MRIIYSTVTAIAILAAPAVAQDYNATNDAQSQSHSQSGSAINRGGDTVYSSTAIAPSGNSTAPCVVANGIGIGALGGGVSFGGGRIDDQCIAKADAALLRDLARMRSAGDPGFRSAVTHLYTNHETIRRSMIALGWLQKVQR